MIPNKKIVSKYANPDIVYNYKWADDLGNPTYMVHVGTRSIDDQRIVQLAADHLGLEILCSVEEFEINKVLYNNSVQPGATFLACLKAVTDQEPGSLVNAVWEGSEVVFKRGVEHGRIQLAQEMRSLLGAAGG